MISSFLRTRSLSFLSSVTGCASGQGLSFHFEVDFYICMGGSDMNVAQPAFDDGKFLTRLEEMHRGRVPVMPSSSA